MQLTGWILHPLCWKIRQLQAMETIHRHLAVEEMGSVVVVVRTAD
jgi:hypothetical protein